MNVNSYSRKKNSRHKRTKAKGIKNYLENCIYFSHNEGFGKEALRIVENHSKYNFKIHLFILVYFPQTYVHTNTHMHATVSYWSVDSG